MFFPGNNNAKLIGTYDLEPEWATVPIRHSPLLWQNSLKREIYATESYLDLCDEFHHKTTFFVVGMFAKAAPYLIKKIADLGHEIGSHSLSHADMISLSEREFTREAALSKSIIEEISGKEVLGYRSPSFSISDSQIHMLSDLGYRYDSSTSTAKRLYGGTKKELKNTNPGFDTLTMTGFIFFNIELTLLGGGYLRITPLPLLKRLKAYDVGNMFYLHPHDFYKSDVSYKHFSTRQKILRKIAVGSTYAKVRYLLGNYEVTTAIGYLS